MKGNQIWMIVGISLVVAVIASVATVSISGNTIFDINKKVSVSLGKTSNFDLDGQRYALTVTKISGNQVSFILRNRDTGKLLNYTAQQSEGVPVWQRYDLYVSDIKAKAVTFVITEKEISSSSVTYDGVLNMLNTKENTGGITSENAGCRKYFLDGGSVGGYLKGISCNEICENPNINKKCLLGFSNKKEEYVNQSETQQDELIGCDMANGPSNIDSINCICC